MELFDPVLLRSPLFDGMSEADIRSVLTCMQAVRRSYARRETVLEAGQPARWIGVVLRGSVRIEKLDYYGNRSVLATLDPPDLFGEAFACAGTQLSVRAEAAEESTVLLLDSRRITAPCASCCPFHSRMIRNLLQVLARKNLLLNQKLEIVSRRTTREKLLAYFSAEARRVGSSDFTLPYDRQTLADYLGVDRSAMSAEIGRLRDDGLIEADRRRIRLLRPEDGV